MVVYNPATAVDAAKITELELVGRALAVLEERA
ncbi:hypothetical protein JOH50_003885 [Rhizobium leguminosarum]|jgi:hypothetical protein|nr:hypothetical protein [Rhizobium leguminosarum]